VGRNFVQAQHLKRESNEWVQAPIGLAILVLVLVGVSGTIYKVLSPDGWLTSLLGNGLSSAGAAGAALAALGAFAWIAREWVGGKARNRITDLVLITSAAAGAIYLVQLWVKGSF
jgi:hypothetical protein